MNDYYTKLSIQLDSKEKEQLFLFQKDFDYIPFETESGPDGNFLYRDWLESDLPDFFFIKYGDAYNLSTGLIFLKNKGSVVRHKDVNRFCSITFPLTDTSTSTLFWESEFSDIPVEELNHNGDSYLQNNLQWHSVPESKEERIFLQMTFKSHTYNTVRERLNDYW